MNRGEFLKIIGCASLITATGLPSFAEVEEYIAKVDGITDEDPFWHIRKLMKDAAQPDWEYHFRAAKEPTFEEGENRKEYRYIYSVFLLQNGNDHRESYYELEGLNPFNERMQQETFRRLMHGVKMFNYQPVERQEEIRQLMKSLKRRL